MALESAFNRDAVAHRLRSGRSGLCPLLRFSCSRSSSWGELASFSGGPHPNRTGRCPPAVLRTFHTRPLRLPFRRVMRSRQTLLSRIASVWRAVPDTAKCRDSDIAAVPFSRSVPPPRLLAREGGVSSAGGGAVARRDSMPFPSTPSLAAWVPSGTQCVPRLVLSWYHKGTDGGSVRLPKMARKLTRIKCCFDGQKKSRTRRDWAERIVIAR